MLGPPGSGKGTQGPRLAARLAIPHVSTGDMLREARASGTDLGRRAAATMDRGNLVADDIMVAIVVERIGGPDCGAGFVLDGFPRTVAQAEALNGGLDALGLSLTHVVLLRVPHEEILRRLAGRMMCDTCGRPATEGQGRADRCACGGKLITREDDRPDAVKRRLEVYTAQTQPLCDWYAQRGLLRDIDGVGSVDAVAGRLHAALLGAVA